MRPPLRYFGAASAGSGDSFMTHQFHQLDVFSDRPLRGNPLAVVHAADDLTPDQMAAFARWTNLSETTFLCRPSHPSADYRVRIYTPGGEMPFAGHPTLGSCHAWLLAGGKPQSPEYIIQECGVGLVRIRRRGTRLAFAAPPLLHTGDLEEPVLRQIASGLGIERSDIIRHQRIDNGPDFVAVTLASAEQVLALRPDNAVLGALRVGVMAPRYDLPGVDYEVRCFVPAMGVPEDPVTGSLNAALASWLIPAGLAPSIYVVSQGTVLQRQGRVYVEQAGADIWVGGEVSVCVSGTVAF